MGKGEHLPIRPILEAILEEVNRQLPRFPQGWPSGDSDIPRTTQGIPMPWRSAWAATTPGGRESGPEE